MGEKYKQIGVDRGNVAPVATFSFQFFDSHVYSVVLELQGTVLLCLFSVDEAWRVILSDNDVVVWGARVMTKVIITIFEYYDHRRAHGVPLL